MVVRTICCFPFDSLDLLVSTVAIVSFRLCMLKRPWYHCIRMALHCCNTVWPYLPMSSCHDRRDFLVFSFADISLLRGLARYIESK